MINILRSLGFVCVLIAIIFLFKYVFAHTSSNPPLKNIEKHDTKYDTTKA